jgi:hypothetical protein
MTDLPIRANVSSKEMKNLSRLSALTNIIVPHSSKIDIIENLYDMVETIQKICTKMNSYFGKKVGAAYLKINIIFIIYALPGDFYDSLRIHLPHNTTLLSH